MVALLAAQLLLAVPGVDIMQFSGPVGPVTARYFQGALRTAERRGAQCLVVELDTPGGLDESMRTIVQAILASRIPVVTYVYPPGSRSASAGVFIMLASHVAAMAPGTNMGAAHPVSVGGPMDSTMAGKVTNDAAAYAKALAARRGRSVAWAERVVRESIAATPDEALRARVIEIIAPSPESLLARLDGRTIETAAGPVTLATRGAPVHEVEMTPIEKLLAILANPNIAYILLMLGIYGLFFELQNPGAIFPGVVGGICLILAFFAFQLLPVNYAGLALILVAIVLFILEIKITSHGLLTMGGVVAMVIGSLMLFESTQPYYRLSPFVIAAVVAVTVLLFGLVIGLVVRAHRRQPTTGPEGIIGETGEARTDLAPTGMVLVHGEHWSARARGGPIPEGQTVRVVGRHGMVLEVEAQ